MSLTFYLCVMIEVLFIRVPAESGTRKFVYSLTVCLFSGECYNEALGYKNKEVALRRLLGKH